VLSPVEKDLWIPRILRDPIAWRPAGVMVHAFDDVMYPADKRVVQAIRDEFDSAIIPVTVIRAYRAGTGEFRLYRFHAVASHEPEKVIQPAWSHRVVTSCRGPLLKRPTHMNLHLEDRTTRKGDGLPGQHLQFDWRVYYALRSMYDEFSADQLEAYDAEHGREAQARRRLEVAQSRSAQRERDDRPWLKRKMENILSEMPNELRKKLAERALKRQTMVLLNEVAR
jgi:hypothetical protein